MFDNIKNFFLKKRLMKANPKDIPYFSFNGIRTIAKVVKVYDGDTITIIFEYNGKMIKYSCRIFGIDTPEIRSQNPEERKLAYEARDFLRSLILNKIVHIELLKFDKYGRLLINVFTESSQNISDIMIEKKYAKPYFGGKK